MIYGDVDFLRELEEFLFYFEIIALREIDFWIFDDAILCEISENVPVEDC